MSEKIPNDIWYNRILQALAELYNKGISWFNNLTTNQMFVLLVLGSLVIAERNSKNPNFYYYSKPKLIPRKNFPDNTKKNAKFRQGMVCDDCKKIPDVWVYHHKDGNRSNNSLENCQGLCPNCHAKIHRNKQNKFRF